MSVTYSAGMAVGLQYQLDELPPHISYETLDEAVWKEFPEWETVYYGNGFGEVDENTGVIIAHKKSHVKFRDINYNWGAKYVDPFWIYDLAGDMQEIADHYGLPETSGIYCYADVG